MKGTFVKFCISLETEDTDWPSSNKGTGKKNSKTKRMLPECTASVGMCEQRKINVITLPFIVQCMFV